MPTKYYIFLLSLTLGVSSFFFLPIKLSKALVSSCSASISPTSVNTNRPTDFSLTLNNTSSENILYIRVTRPSANFTLNSIGLSDWPGSADGTYGTLTGGTLAASGSATISITATSGSTEAASSDWTVEVADDESGNDLTTCTGSLGTAISGIGSTDTTPPTISDLVVSDVAQTSVKITWTTDENSDSVIDYGISEDYGSTKSDSTQSTSHSLTIDSLSANTTYHFNVKSSDSVGNTSEAGDNTFVSSKAATTSTTTVTNTTTTTTTVVKLVEDTEKPDISFTTKFDKPFSISPEIKGKVTDNAGVSEVEYSIDGGLNYLPVDELNTPRTKSSTFSFLLSGLLDGDYKIRVRATDLSGNIALSDIKTLVFDRLAPSVGGLIHTLGSYVLESDEGGVLTTITGLSQKIILSAVGGPTSIEVISKLQITNYNEKPTTDNRQPTTNFSLSKNSDTGLWSGDLNFDIPGIYDLEAISIDGAENKTTKKIGSIKVLPMGRVGDSRSSISIYYFEPSIQNFVLWDAVAYGQKNPVSTDENGNYSLVLPAGKYYLEIQNTRYGIRDTEIFTLDKITPINTDFNLGEEFKIKIGSLNLTLPDIFQPTLHLSNLIENGKDIGFNQANPLLGQEFPYFNLTADKVFYDNFYFRGKKTIYFFLNTWLPSASAQISSVESLYGDKRLNAIMVISQESISKTWIFQKRGDYETLFLADPDGILFTALNINKLPAFIITDRKGIIEEIGSGIITKAQILKKL